MAKSKKSNQKYLGNAARVTIVSMMMLVVIFLPTTIAGTQNDNKAD